jgi:hypothetical protein
MQKPVGLSPENRKLWNICDEAVHGLTTDGTRKLGSKINLILLCSLI